MTRILFVEDDPDQRENIQLILRRAFPNYEIIAVGGLGEATAKLQELRAVSLVLADYQLPDGTAYDLLKYCQEHLTNVPFIIITAYGETDDEKEVRAALSFRKGAFDFVRKRMIDYDELIERIKHAIEISEALA